MGERATRPAGFQARQVEGMRPQLQPVECDGEGDSRGIVGRIALARDEPQHQHPGGIGDDGAVVGMGGVLAKGPSGTTDSKQISTPTRQPWGVSKTV